VGVNRLSSPSPPPSPPKGEGDNRIIFELKIISKIISFRIIARRKE
jgi:hypothetical protein